MEYSQRNNTTFKVTRQLKSILNFQSQSLLCLLQLFRWIISCQTLLEQLEDTLAFLLVFYITYHPISQFKIVIVYLINPVRKQEDCEFVLDFIKAILLSKVIKVKGVRLLIAVKDMVAGETVEEFDITSLSWCQRARWC